MNGKQSKTFFPDTPLWRWVLLGFLLISAFGVRMIHLKELPLDFHPTRQYRSAMLARAFYLDSAQSIPAWRKDVIQAQREDLGLLEPPLFEIIVAQIYKLTGTERLWIPRLLSILFWLLGGGFVFVIAYRLGSVDTAALAAAFFLFVPFGIRASRSFQPDVLMLTLLIWTLYLLLRYRDNPTWTHLYLAATAAGLATFVKPQGVFMLLVTAIAVVGYRDGQKLRHLMVFLSIVLFPGLLYYGYHFLLNQSMHRQVTSSFIPSLWFEVYYWQFWLKHLWRVIGFSALVGGMFGILVTPAGWKRNFMTAMWLGYVIFGLFYTYYIHTHDYYHLQFIPAVALALGFLGASVLQQLILVNQHRIWRVLISCVLIFSMFLNSGLYLNTLAEVEDSPSHTQLAEQIGALVNHSARTLFLAPYYGAPLEYHGELAGIAWPTVGDIRAEQLVGAQPLSAVERLNQYLQEASPEYFIVTDMTEYEAQTDLRTLLSTRYPILEQSEDFIIFDLRQH